MKVNVCFNSKLIVDLKRSNNSYFNEVNFEMFSRRSKSLTFAQKMFTAILRSSLQNINQQKLNLFEGLAHGEKLFSL